MFFLLGCVLQAGLFALSDAAGAGLRFKGEHLDYAEYETWDFSFNGTLSFLFHTHKQTAFLLYQDNRRNERGQDYMDVFIHNGNIRMRFSFAFCRQISELTVHGAFSDSKWHYVDIYLGFDKVSLSVDDIASSKDLVDCQRREYPRELAALRKRRWAVMYLGGVAVTKKLSSTHWSSPTILQDALSSRFQGCIGNLLYQKGTQAAVKARLKKKENVVSDCDNACASAKCQHGGTCIDHILSYECDCTGTGYEGDKCINKSSMVYMNGSGYITYKVLIPKIEWSMENNQISFRFVPLRPDGVILYLGNPTDHLIVEMVRGTIRIDINLGGGSLIMRSNVTLNVSEYHYVEITRRKQRMTLDINHRWHVKTDATPGTLFSLDLKGDQRVAYFGGGPGSKGLSLSASKRNFSGFLQELKFDDFKVLDKVMYSPKDKRFGVFGEVLDGRMREDLLPLGNSEKLPGSGCSELEDDEDMEGCVPRPTARCTSPDCMFVVTDPPDRSTNRPGVSLPERVTYGSPTKGVVMSQRKAPPDHRVSPWIIIIIVAAAVVAVIITIFLLYRWNNRYTGSFKPSKGEPLGEGAQPVIAQRGYEQPAFYVSPNKPTKGETVA